MKVQIMLIAALIVLPGCRTISEAQINSSVDRIVRAIKGEIGEYYEDTGPVTGVVTEPVKDPDRSIMDRADLVIRGSGINGIAFHWSAAVQTKPSTLTLSDIQRANEYAYWADHSFFLVQPRAVLSPDPLDPSVTTFAYAYSIGVASNRNPVSVSAAWRGEMAGVDESDTAYKGNIVEGDALITLSSGALGITLSGIRDTSVASRTHRDISWRGLKVLNGRFRASDLSGSFYGSEHQEVGGVFLKQQISGAFGAKK